MFEIDPNPPSISIVLSNPCFFKIEHAIILLYPPCSLKHACSVKIHFPHSKNHCLQKHYHDIKFLVESKNTFKGIVLLEYPFLYDILKVFENSVITRNIIDINHYEKNLHKVVFKDFKSTIIFSDGITEIDKTNFENDVLDFSFYGNYNLENLVDYHLSFNWADIVRKKKSKSDIVQENPVKGKQLYLKISGPVEDLSYGFDKSEIKKERKEIISNEKEIIKDIIKGDYQEDEKKSEVFELEKETLEKDTIQELKDRQNLKAKKKKDSSKLDKFLKKLGVEEPEKKKPEFEIDQ